MTIADGFRRRTSRLAYRTQSVRREPPNPQFNTAYPEKSCWSDFQSRIDELPEKTIGTEEIGYCDNFASRAVTSDSKGLPAGRFGVPTVGVPMVGVPTR